MRSRSAPLSFPTVSTTVTPPPPSVSAISLFTRCTVPLPHADQRRHLQYAVPGAQMRPDGVLDLGRYLGAAELLALLAHTIQAGSDMHAKRPATLPTTCSGISGPLLRGSALQLSVRHLNC